MSNRLAEFDIADQMIKLIMEKHPAPSVSKHSDRVTRITQYGVAVTMPRVSIIDGKAI